MSNQYLLSVRNDVPASDETLQQLKTDYIDVDKTCIDPDGMFSGASDLPGLTQSFLQNEDITVFLEAVDNDFKTNGIK